jgi:hypothetical protein
MRSQGRPAGGFRPGGGRPGYRPGGHPGGGFRPGSGRPGYRPWGGHSSFGGYHRPEYSRPPYVWGGRRYYSYNPYFYHPYRPYFYGPYFHPLGFFIGGLAATAIILSVEDQQYAYDRGVYYQRRNDGYVVVAPPIGAHINTLPDGYATVTLGDNSTFYYFAGTFYIDNGTDFEVVDAPAGAVVYNLPQGCTTVNAGDITYFQYNNTLFQPIVINGTNAYEVVEAQQ